MKKILDFETTLKKEYILFAGIDEAGRGSLAGPIVVVSVVLPPNFSDICIQDSKILTVRQRNGAYFLIRKRALEIKVVVVDVREIEKNNPLQATKKAMFEAASSLKTKVDICLVDGKEEIKVEGLSTLSVVAGDSKSINIAAASIVAKVVRDSIMKKLHLSFPVYGWNVNKGYFSLKHFLALLRFGPSSLHRGNYEPVKSLLDPNRDLEEIKNRYKHLKNFKEDCVI